MPAGQCDGHTEGLKVKHKERRCTTLGLPSRVHLIGVDVNQWKRLIIAQMLLA